MANNTNIQLIEQMKVMLADGTNLANFLMESLFLSKEAVYRRLRDEVPFSFSEALTISGKLGISLDAINANTFNGNAMFEMAAMGTPDPIDAYEKKLDLHNSMMETALLKPGSRIHSAYNGLPIGLHLRHDVLSRFRLFKWMHRHGNCCPNLSFDQFEMPDIIREKQRIYTSHLQHIEHTDKIIDSAAIHNYCNDVIYFQSMGLMSDQNVAAIKEDLLSMIDGLASLAAAGEYKTGKKINIYVSPLNFEASYSYFESATHNYSLIQIFFLNSVTSIDDSVRDCLKTWFQTMRNCSILISQSGAIERRKYIAKQKSIVERKLAQVNMFM